MKKLIRNFLILALILAPATPVFAGGDEEQSNRVEELEKALEDQMYKTRELEDKLEDLKRQLEELKNRPPQIIREEKVIEKTEKEPKESKAQPMELPIHGFFNVNYADPNYEGYNGTYDQEKFNLIFNYQLDENFKFYGEIGTKHGEEIDVDLTSVEGVGDVDVVQAWLDWKINEDLTLKFGKYLTPYGNWNIPLHSPAVYLSIWEPLLVKRDVFPKTVTGIQAYGKKELANFDVVYTLYTGNGKGWRPHSEDDNTNKCVGTRVGIIAPFFKLGTIELGVSGFVGRDGTIDDEDQDVIAFDGLIKAYPVEIRGEFATSDYDLATADYEKDIWYVQASYNFLEKYDAYIRYDKENTYNTPYTNIDDYEITSIGINYKPIPVVAFKVEYDFYDTDLLGTYEVIAGSVAVDF